MIRPMLLTTTLVLGLSAVAGCASSTASNPTRATLTVAAFNPFTGPDAAFGPEMMAGCEAAAHAINAAGGVLTDKVQCQSFDTRGDPADAVTGADRMLAVTSNLFGVLGPSSDEADATAPVISAAKVTMFGDTGEASFDHTTLPYFWRLTPADDVKGYAMALYAIKKGYLRAAAVFGNDISSQSNLPTLLKAYRQLGGKMVSTQNIALGQTSYRTEVEQLIAARPQVIFTEASPQADATFLSELQQLGHLVPVIGTDATIQPQWLTAVSGAVGKGPMSQMFVAEQPYAPASGPSWAAYNANLLASTSVPKPAQWSSDSYSMSDYDAVIIMALAAVAAKSVNPASYNSLIPAVTTPSPGATIVHSFAQGLAALKAGHKISYVGAAGIVDFNKWHNSAGGFEVAAYGPNGSLNLVDSITAAQIAPLLK
jgi:ABC-type branched-subunit amino acid transport system substrate-binding protein